jgi:hypothetical protein
MADRYATNQFYNFGNYEPGIGKASNRTTQDNPKFIWPNDVNKNAAIGPEGTTKIQRGYMKMITSAYGDALGADNLLHNRRLHFQFNPDTLTRMVSARNDIQMWQNQDPFQFTQPIPGDANFSFDLLFNREAELASGSYRNNNGKVVKSEKAANISRTVIEKDAPVYGAYQAVKQTVRFEDNPYDQSWVTDIGVLADLMVFDQIIGQGMNKGLIEAIVTRAGEVTSAYNLANPGGGTEDEEDKEVTFDKEKTEIFLGTNIGNSAFLIAQPIRVVFSSSFMVEGFITSTAVVFNKFNTAMVPTQCQIAVQMQAMYIGFANKDTYLTTLYKDYDASTAFGVESGSGTEQTAENKALKKLGEDLTKDYETLQSFRTTKDAYVLNAFRIFNDDGDGTTDLKVSVSFSESTKTWAKEKKGTITPHIHILMTYLGRASGAPATNLAYGINQTAFETTINGTCNMTDVGKGRDTITFKIENPKDTTSKSFDRASNAKYKIKATVFFTLESSTGSVTAPQIGVAEKQSMLYNEIWFMADSMNGKVPDESVIKELENGS